MRFKRCKCDRIDFNLQDDVHLSFKKDYISVKYVKEILIASEGIQQVNLFKKIASHILQNDLEEDELNFVINALSIAFCQAPSKSSHKKALNRIIEEISTKHPLPVENYLEKSLGSLISLSALCLTPEEIEAHALHILYLIDNLKLGKKIVNLNFLDVWKHICLMLQTVVEKIKKEKNLQKKDDYYDICQNILKLITQFTQGCDQLKDSLRSHSDIEFNTSSENIRICLLYLLSHEETKLNCRLNAAFVFCHFYYFIFGEKKLKDDLLCTNSAKFSLSSQLCIYSGVMAVLPVENFIEITNGYMLAAKIVRDIIKISKSSNSSEVLVLCTRNILQWTNVIQNVFTKELPADENKVKNIAHLFSEDKEFMEMLFEYVLHNREHFIDSIRHLCKDIFKNILNIHVLSSGIEPSESPLLKEMTIYLLKELPSHCRSKYGMLSCIVEKIGTKTILQWHSLLPIDLFEALEDCSLVSHVSELSQMLFSCTADSGDDTNFQNTWLVPLLKVLCDGSKEQTNAVSEHILPKLLDVKPSSLVFLLSKLSYKWETDIGNSFSALITCLKLYQRQRDFYSYLPFLSNSSLTKAFVHADDQVRLSAFSLLCESYKTTEPIHSSTFDLIKDALHYNINCQSPSFRQQLISYLKKFLTRMRDSSYSIMKKQLQDNSNKDIKSKAMFPSTYQNFLDSLKKNLFGYLHPGANFPRRVTSLNLLYTLHEIFQHSSPIVDSETALQTLLYVLQDTYDNNKLLALKILSSKSSLKLEKEDEKLFQSALMLASSTKPPDTATAAYLFTYMIQCSSYQQIIHRHLTSLSSQETKLNLILPNISDSSCDLHLNTIALLMYELKCQLQLAKINILKAAVSAPLYGILTCIRSVLRDVKFNQDSIAVWRHLFKELIMLSFDVANVVEPVVCNSSPEGYLPSETDDDSIAQLQAAVRRALGCRFQTAVVEETPSSEYDAVVVDIVKSHAVTAQLLLLCCWRSHKEVSLLFGDISEKVPLINIGLDEFQGMLHPSDMKKIGQYFLSQMSLVKHKGAFEQAQIGFSKVCNKLWRCDISDLCELPKAWLRDMILSIKGLKEDIQLCPTRRSAGLPFIIQAILTSEPNFLNSSFFKSSISDFLTLAQSNESFSSDVQIHALNVLRTLFRDACLGEAVMPFVSKGLQLSIEGFKSNIWAVRNSSTLLFTALTIRIFGVNRSHDETGKKNRLSGKCFYSYYKDLYLFLIDELNQCVSSSHLKQLNPNKGTKVSIRPSLYPILLILGRLYPAPGEKDTILSVFIPNLKICLCSPIWKTRSLAAKALVSLSPLEKVFSNVKLLLENFDQMLAYTQNEIHGHLLLLRYFMEEIGFMSESEKNDLRCLLQVNFSKYFDFFIRLNACASVRAAFLEVYLYAMVLDLDSSDVLITRSLIQTVMRDCSKSDFCLDADNYLALASSIMFLEICQLSEDDSDNIVSAWPHLPLTKIVECVLCGIHKSLSSTLTEVFLWLSQECYKLPENSLNSCDDVVAQKVLKSVTLVDKRKFDVTKIKEDPDICTSLLQSFHKERDQLLLKQYCKLLRHMPSILTRTWEFVPTTYSCDLLNKLNYMLSKIDNNFRDDVICELLLFSTDMIIILALDYESDEENKNTVTKENFDVIEKWLEKIEECAYPDNSIIFRQTVVTVLDMLTEKLFFPTSKLLGFPSPCFWQSLMLLLVDDEPDIKHGVSAVIVKMKSARDDENKILSAVPSRTVDLMVEMFVQTSRDTNNCISMLVNWMLSSNTSYLDSVNDEQPFDKGEMNVYSEDLQLTDTVSHHLYTYLETLKSPEECLISSQTVSCWNRGHGKVLTFAEAIELCLSEANSILDKFLSRGAVSPILDSLFNEELIQIRQRLVVTSQLLPFSRLLPNFKVLANELLRKFESLDFRTFFIETCVSDILAFLKLL